VLVCVQFVKELFMIFQIQMHTLLPYSLSILRRWLTEFCYTYKPTFPSIFRAAVCQRWERTAQADPNKAAH
jgi:hypothetical protein